MPFPHADRAVVPNEKTTEYLLNVDHPVGGPKARWFIHLGYDPADPDALIHDLLDVAQSCEDFHEQRTQHGVKYIAVGRIVSPKQIVADALTVWIIEDEAPTPLLVTAYPAGK